MKWPAFTSGPFLKTLILLTLVNANINKYTILFNILHETLSIFIYTVLFPCCSVQKEVSHQSRQTDSLRQSSRLTIHTSRIPQSRTRLSILTTKLKELPAGAAFFI